jgi:hypothetical protein
MTCDKTLSTSSASLQQLAAVTTHSTVAHAFVAAAEFNALLHLLKMCSFGILEYSSNNFNNNFKFEVYR